MMVSTEVALIHSTYHSIKKIYLYIKNGSVIRENGSVTREKCAKY